MIRYDGIRAETIATDREIIEPVAHDLESMTDEEYELFRLTHEDPELYKMLIAEEYEEDPIDVEQWVQEEYYSGSFGKSLYPKLMDEFIRIFNGDYNEVIATGGVGVGKTYLAQLGMLRMLYEVSCLKNPQESYGLSDGSSITFATISVTKEVAEEMMFSGIISKVKDIPYFVEKFQYTIEKLGYKILKHEARFPKDIFLSPATSRDTGVIGQNVFGGILDEVNFMYHPKDGRRPVGEGQAERIYTAIKRRMESRFMKRGKLPGILFLVSSKRTQTDFIERRIRESMDDPHVYVLDKAMYEVKPEGTYSSRKFKVFVGAGKMRSRIVASESELTPLEVKDGKVIEVPYDFIDSFKKNIEDSLRDIAGIALDAIRPYIVKREKIDEMVDPILFHPCAEAEWDTTHDLHFFWHRMVQGENMGEVRPILSPYAARYAHIDPSLRADATGICIAHISDKKMVTRSVGDRVSEELAPVITIDLILRVVPPLGDEIVMSKVRSIIYDFSAHGYPIRFVSADNYQSADGLQNFRQKGYRAEVISMDRTMEPYDVLKQAIYENRIRCYDYRPLFHELRNLERDENKGKVDHRPDVSAKDCADALCGVVYSLSMNPMRVPFQIEEGLHEERQDEKVDDGMWVMAGSKSHGMKLQGAPDGVLPVPFMRRK